ncbi:MAG: putative lipid II flippase FtsW [Gammaproteobacteria bacterium]|nr:putative lipid II flippase FtsW [Gammaproteobacteria bacterium]
MASLDNGQAIRTNGSASRITVELAQEVDRIILLLYSILIFLGIIMVASASIGVADQQTQDPFFYAKRQFLRALLGFMLIWVAYRIPLVFWKKNGMLLMLSSIVLLGVVLIPGVGHTVNGSTRWLDFGIFTFQISEIAKLFLVIYLSGYLIRRSDEVQTDTMGFVKPMVVLAFASGLLIMEPDFGAAAILLLTGLGLMFLGGVRFGQFMLFVFGTLSIMVLLAISSEYRMARITSFLDPWADPFNSGFQLTQSLIAIGNGGWFGTGLGGSIQKLFYLPEAHTDFLFAIFAEEFGLFGTTILIGLYAVFALRCFSIGKMALVGQQAFGAYLAYGVGLLTTLQAIINIGVNMGALPTKGLTLPFISYGGNSIISMSFAVGLVLRVYREYQQGDGESALKSRRRGRSYKVKA